MPEPPGCKYRMDREISAASAVMPVGVKPRWGKKGREPTTEALDLPANLHSCT